MKSTVEVFLKINGLKEGEAKKKNDEKHLSCLNVFLMKWESHQHNDLDNQTIRESWCQQLYLSKDNDDGFLQTWEGLCVEMARESMCVEQFFEDNLSSEIFNKSWSKLCRDKVRESICMQKFVQSNESLRNVESIGFVDVLSYFDDMIFRDWIHERGLCVVVSPNKSDGKHSCFKNGGKCPINKCSEYYCCEDVSL